MSEQGIYTNQELMTFKADLGKVYANLKEQHPDELFFKTSAWGMKSLIPADLKSRQLSRPKIKAMLADIAAKGDFIIGKPKGSNGQYWIQLQGTEVPKEVEGELESNVPLEIQSFRQLLKDTIGRTYGVRKCQEALPHFKAHFAQETQS